MLCYRFATNLECVSVAQVIVRNLDDRVVSRLKQRAKLQGHSLEQELREILGRAARPTKEERLALSRRARAMTPPDVPQADSVELLRQDRDSR
jgi:antitoxin FitA